MTAPDTQALEAACEALAQKDTALAKAYDQVGLPRWRVVTPDYQSLARIVVYQLISTRAADAIWGRIVDRYGTVTARAILSDDQDGLQACGLSRQKLAHLNAIARAVEEGALGLKALSDQPVEVARANLLQIKGIGPWTADTFLMTAIGHLDAFPSGDVGLLEAYKQLSRAEKRLSSKAFTAQADNWRPWRAVAAHLLYDWLNAGRAR